MLGSLCAETIKKKRFWGRQNLYHARTRRSETFNLHPIAKERAIGTSKKLLDARDERYLTRAIFLRHLAATYELHCNNDITTHPASVWYYDAPNSRNVARIFVVNLEYTPYEIVCAQRNVKRHSVETPATCSCCCNVFFLLLVYMWSNCGNIADFSTNSNPTHLSAGSCVFKHTAYVSINSNPTHFPAGPSGQTH